MPARAVKDFLDGLRVLVPLGVLCLCGDLDLIGLMAEGAFKWDEEHRGLGITRKAWGLDSWPVQRMKEKFRFERDDIQLLMDELGFPPDEYWKTPSGSLFTREEAMLFYLRRMSYPNKLTNLVEIICCLETTIVVLRQQFAVSRQQNRQQIRQQNRN